jgi:dipeptidyl aminopeptidase/acylaminoacyl peptidase
MWRRSAVRRGGALLVAVCLATGCTGGGRDLRPASASSGASGPGATPSTTAPLRPVTPPPGRLVFALRDGQDVHLWTMDTDGRRRRQLTRQPGVDFDPSWSPDGRQVLFRTNRGRYRPDPSGTGTEAIFLIDADGSHERQLYPPSPGLPGGLFADWAPDGRRVALSTVRNGAETVVVVDLRGRLQRDLHGVGECADWSPDGRWILFCSRRSGSWNAWVMRAAGRGQAQVSPDNGDTYPGGWSPDGRRVVFGGGRAGIYLARPDGRDARRVPLPLPGFAAAGGPTAASCSATTPARAPRRGGAWSTRTAPARAGCPPSTARGRSTTTPEPGSTARMMVEAPALPV